MPVEILIGWAISKAADAIASKTNDLIKSQLNKTDIQKAMESGIRSSIAWEATQNIKERLFFFVQR